MGRGAVVCLLTAVLGALGGCGSGKVPIDEQDVSAADAATCAALVEDLPDTLAGELRRSVDPDDALGAAWGDPAYVLTCGVPKPGSYTRNATCNDFGGTGWFVPDDELGDLRVDAHAVALTHTPYVELLVPTRYRTEGIDAALSELAPILKKHLAAGEPCL